MDKRKKIILYNPKADFFTMPLALLAIGSVIDPEKYEVVIVDGRLVADAERVISAQIQQALCFATTVITGSPITDALDISQKVKSLRPEIPVIWGGWHASLFPEQILADSPFVDITVRGQGEVTFKELVNSLDNNLPLSGVRGICFRMNHSVIKNTPRPMVDIETLPPINYGLIDVDTYFQKKAKRQFDYVSSVGCRFRCSFCADPSVFGRKFSAKSSGKMAAEIEFFHQQYQFTDLNFQDETFFTQPKRVEGFAREIIDRNIKISWAATMRADQGARIPVETWHLLKRSGLRQLLIGVESGSQSMMDHLQKDILLEQVFTCAAKCKEFNISVNFPFIVGFPGESNQSVLDTIEIIKRLRKYSVHFQTPLFFFQPYPGSKITNELVVAGVSLPVSTCEWGEFHFGRSYEWVPAKKKQFFKAFMFYLNMAYGEKRFILLPFRLFARWRCRYNRYELPLGMRLFDFVRKSTKV